MNDARRKKMYEEISGYLYRVMVEEKKDFLIDIEHGITRKPDESGIWFKSEFNDTETIVIKINGGARQIIESERG